MYYEPSEELGANDWEWELSNVIRRMGIESRMTTSDSQAISHSGEA